MQFRNKLRQLIETNGGTAPENLDRIVQRAREVVPEFSRQRLAMLLSGRAQPTRIDTQAVEHALGSVAERDPIADFATPRLRSPVLVEQFVAYVSSAASFRYEQLSEQDLEELLKQFKRVNEPGTETEVFRLPNDGP
jgi:hypothetical protein